MRVLVPVDDSDCGFRALSFAAEFVRETGGELHVVHIAGSEDETSRAVVDRARQHLEAEGVTADPEVVTDLGLSAPRYGTQIGKDILELVERREVDHVVMGHHGEGRVERLVLGSAARTVVESGAVPVTVIP